MEPVVEEEKENARQLDLSCNELRTLDVALLQTVHSFKPEYLRKLVLYGNVLNTLPSAIAQFPNLHEIDVSSNDIGWISGEISQLRELKVLEARNNRLSILPKEIASCSSLRVLNLSGNLFTDISDHIIPLVGLQELYLGGNKIAYVPPVIQNMESLEILYLGGNEICDISPQLTKLKYLRHLFLCDNKLQSIPRELGNMKSLESLSLHKNLLTTLPLEIVKLFNLQELTLRDNPLVNTFIKKLEFSPPSLLELSGRTIKAQHVTYDSNVLPRQLKKYLDSAKCCVNPKCDGVYFDSRVKNVKFVDFCGKFRLPLEQYLCSPNENCNEFCDKSDSVDAKRLQKVLLPAEVVDSD